MGIRHIFVYGTLMRGMSNHDRFCGDALTIEPAVTTGLLYHLPYGFPAMFDAPDGQVFGEVMTFPEIGVKLKELDCLEGYRPCGDSHYLRVVKSATILTCNKESFVWCYVYPDDRLSGTFCGKPITTGRWSRR